MSVDYDHESDAMENPRIESAMELFLEELEAGRCPNIDDFLVRFSDVASELRSHLEGLQFLHGLSPQQADRNAHVTDHLKPRETLGDFRLMRPIGRGGMGVVYEAEQLSLGRTVAVKVLPFAAMLDEQQLKRFQNEARASATMDHPNIVPIHFVGHERCVHFYAMQLVEGQSLAELISELQENKSNSNVLASDKSSNKNSSVAQSSWPSRFDHRSSSKHSEASKAFRSRISTQRSSQSQEYFKSIAKLGIQAAEALEHAHQLGILHRDIKPGNMLVDAKGKLWVTDFGLASFEHEEGVTRTGGIVGTAAYMSPEQAAGSRLVDCRSDIFSLGASLCELSLLRRPTAGDSNQSGIHQRTRNRRELGQASFSRLTSLRRVNPQIPADFETILLKAISMEPNDRYPSAQAMADDLRRFAEGRAIKTKRTTLVERFWRWLARHRGLTLLALAGLLILMSLMAVTVGIVLRAKARTKSALGDSKRHAEYVEDLLYMADVQLAYQAWDGQRIDQVIGILDRQKPSPGQLDRRGDEWYLLHDLAEQPQPKILGKHDGSANAMDVFPDGRRVATVGDDGLIRIWDVDSEKLLTAINTGKKKLASVAISPDGSTIATGSTVVNLWDADSGKLARELMRHQHTIQAISFSPNGEYIVTGSRFDDLRLFSASGTLLKTVLDQRNSRHRSLEFTPDGTRLLIPSRSEKSDGGIVGFIRVWRSDLNSVERDIYSTSEKNAGDFTYATCSPDGSFYAISEHYRPKCHTRLFDARTGNELLRLPPHRDRINVHAISSDGRQLAAGFADGSVSYWNIHRREDGTLTRPERTYSLWAHQGEVMAIRFIHSSRLITCGRDGNVSLWNLKHSDNPRVGGAGISCMDMAANDYAVAIIDDGRGWQLANSSGQLVYLHRLRNQNRCNVVAISSNGSRLAVGDDQGVELRDGQNGNLIRRFELGSRVNGIGFAPSRGELAAVSHHQGEISVFDTKRIEKRKRVSIGQDGVYKMRYSPDEKRLLIAGGEIGIQILDADSLKVLRTIDVSSPVRTLAFDPTSTILASGHHDASIRFWNWPNGTLRTVLLGHERVVTSLAFSPDSRTLASSSFDCTTRLWSTEFEREFGIMDRRSVGGSCVAFSSSGNKLFAAYTDSPGLAVFKLKRK